TSSVLPAKLTPGVSDQAQIHRYSDSPQTYRSEAERAGTYQHWLHHYNHHRPHTGIGGMTPIERLRVHNLPVKNI
ncbi:integrase core domain-containing protein, partial [Mycobacteroides abscessus]